MVISEIFSKKQAWQNFEIEVNLNRFTMHKIPLLLTLISSMELKTRGVLLIFNVKKTIFSKERFFLKRWFRKTALPPSLTPLPPPLSLATIYAKFR